MRRATVVWRPRSSLARTALVAMYSAPSSALTSVDLPTPLSPSSRAVIPGAMSARISSTPWSSLEAIARQGTLGASWASCARASSTCRGSTQSALVSTKTGRAPQPQAAVIWRAARRMSRPSPVRLWQRKTRSALAASTWRRTCFSRPTRFTRAISTRRGMIWAMMAFSWPSGMRRATQSPTATMLSSLFLISVASSARSSSDAVFTRGYPRSSEVTRPGSSPSSSASAHAATASVKPRSSHTIMCPTTLSAGSRPATRRFLAALCGPRASAG